MHAAPPENLEDFLHVPWEPGPASARAAMGRRRFIGALSSLVITVLLWGGFYLWSRRSGESWQGTGQWPVTVVVLALSVVLVAVRSVLWILAVRHRRRVGDGEVLTASWPGVQIAGRFWDWDRFAAASTGDDAASMADDAAGTDDVVGVVRTIRGRWGRADRYLFVTPEGPWECEVDDLGITPAALEQSLRLYSQGRCLVDLSGLAH
ncbi:hypothetical protein [Raineyella fluvialis]|uniref:Uncharacterized protein n=1 Tax=Raineyella fluvialis TaxID=2662261 RepID=A0A5Q2FHJ7_9ACTN|nr:hypothetical protein [Raineyella fluvialis]QGF23816.1 hypothetical protein Rai3103_09180 [Raineyella fluvialis]